MHHALFFFFTFVCKNVLDILCASCEEKKINFFFSLLQMSFVALFGDGGGSARVWGTGPEGVERKGGNGTYPGSHCLPCYHSPSILALLPSFWCPGCFLMPLKAGSRGIGWKPFILRLVSSETPDRVQEKPLTFRRGCRQWSSGTWKSAWKIPAGRGAWCCHSSVDCGIPSEEPHPRCGSPGVPTGTQHGQQLPGWENRLQTMEGTGLGCRGWVRSIWVSFT